MSIDPRMQARINVLHEHVRMENSHNLDGIMSTFGKDPIFILNGTAIHGHDSIRSLYDGFGFGGHGGFSNVRADVLKQHLSEHAIILEMILSGTHTSEWQGIQATGRSFELQACAVVTFDAENRMSGERVYFDGALLLKQLGILK